MPDLQGCPLVWQQGMICFIRVALHIVKRSCIQPSRAFDILPPVKYQTSLIEKVKLVNRLTVAHCKPPRNPAFLLDEIHAPWASASPLHAAPLQLSRDLVKHSKASAKHGPCVSAA
eukprot:1156432-Pelagomonas_calceolata.AAC.3